MPNLNKWHAGDIIVMERPANGTTAAIVEAYQKAVCHASAHQYADCTHCAVYLGHGMILDSRFGRRIWARRLWPDTIGRRMCVLRLKDSVISKDELHMFLEELLELEGRPYSYSPVALTNWHLGSIQKNHKMPTGLVCSAIVECAAKQAGFPLATVLPNKSGPILPANLVGHPWLEFIPAEWCLPS